MIKVNLSNAVSEIHGFIFLCRNLWASRKIKTIHAAEYCNLTICGLRFERLNEMEVLHKELRNGRIINFWRKTMLRFRGPTMCGIVISNNLLAGFSLFYFREDEIVQNVIHEAFIGLESGIRGVGASVALRKHMARHFALCGLRGISTQVDYDNIPSLKSAQKAGFRIVEYDITNHKYQLYFDISTLKSDSLSL